MMKNKLYKTLTLLVLSFSFVSCYTWWEKPIPMDTDAKNTSLADYLYEEPSVTSLEAPTQVYASQGLYSSKIKVAWNAIDKASSYRIERAVVTADINGNYPVPEEGDFKVVSKACYKTTFDDTIIENVTSSNEEYNNKYYYRVSAENLGKGYESSEFTEITNPKTNACGWLLPAPKNLEAGKGKSLTEIDLAWTPVKNARSYEIYRSEKIKTGYELIDTVRGNCTSYSDEMTEADQGMEFYYKVKAKISIGEESAFSDYALGYSSVEGAPSAPASVYVDNGLGTSTSSLTLKWTPVSVSGSKTLTYAIYRTSSVDSVYTLLAKYTSDKTSYEDKSSLKPGVYYYYYIQSIFTDTVTQEVQKSSFSETGPDSEKPAYGFLLTAPSTSEVAEYFASGIPAENGKVVLRWTPAIGSETETYTYNIYYADDQAGPFELLEMNISPSSLSSDGYYEIEADKKNFYKISTINVSGLESAKGTTIAPLPDAPTNITATKTSQFGFSVDAYNTNGVYPVQVTWKAPATGAYGYKVYRSTKPDSSFRCLTDEPVTANNNGTFNYVDTNETARAGTPYYYKVVSVNVLGQGKKSNDPTTDTSLNCVGYGAITRDQWFREYNKSIMSSQAKLTLMHKANDMDKLGSETIKGNFTGTLSYKAAIAGLGAEITMHYQDYSDFEAALPGLGKNGLYFVLTGNTDTSSNMSANGNMHEKVNCTGMYPGYAIYDHLEIKGGAAGGGYYLVETYDLNGTKILSEDKVDWTVGEQH